MTPRTYWDRMEPVVLWEQHPETDAVRPLIDEEGNLLQGPGFDTWWRRDVVERVYGPLIGAA